MAFPEFVKWTGEAVDERVAQLKDGVGRINRRLSFYPDVKIALTSV